MKTVYQCSNTVTGIFSAIYDGWKERRDEEWGIKIKEDGELELFSTYVEVEENNRKVLAVESMIKRHLGYAAYWDIYHAALSFDYSKGNAIAETILEARKLKDSKKIMEHLSNPSVLKVFALSRNVGGEAHNLTGFVRFKELQSQILYGEITPKNQVLTCLAPHFADRLPVENWMIYDKSHHMLVVHEAKKQWVLVSDEELKIEKTLQFSEKEEEFSRMWKGFCKSISIASRENRRCQMNHLPLRYRGNMTEFVLS